MIHRSYATTAVTIGEGVYKKARAFVPSAVEPYVTQVEDKAAEMAAPLVSKVQDKAAELLTTIDGKVRKRPAWAARAISTRLIACGSSSTWHRPTAAACGERRMRHHLPPTPVTPLPPLSHHDNHHPNRLTASCRASPPPSSRPARSTRRT
jgi:hypothetical protein